MENFVRTNIQPSKSEGDYDIKRPANIFIQINTQVYSTSKIQTETSDCTRGRMHEEYKGELAKPNSTKAVVTRTISLHLVEVK